MTSSDLTLPSNKKFGLFFSAVFFLLGALLYEKSLTFSAFSFYALSVCFFLISFIKPHLFIPLNKFWMSFGKFLGVIISPIVLGLIFFGIVTPMSIAMRIFKRDELDLKFLKKASYWKRKIKDNNNSNFEQQY